jgi:hypothetical protein
MKNAGTLPELWRAAGAISIRRDWRALFIAFGMCLRVLSQDAHWFSVSQGDLDFGSRVESFSLKERSSPSWKKTLLSQFL